MAEKQIRLSVVIPAHDEESNIAALHSELSSVLKDHGSYEILFVDDGSTDGTLDEIVRLAATGAPVRYVSLSRNFGHQEALRAGLEYSRGACVVTMDADFQHPPDLIPDMIAKWEGGAQIVLMIRNDTAQTSWFKRLSSVFFYRFLNWISKVRIEPGSADFRLLDRVVVDVIKRHREANFFLRGLIPSLGFTTARIPFTPNERLSGTSSYSLVRMISLGLTGVIANSVAPLRLGLVLASIVAGIALVYGVYAAYVYFMVEDVVPGWTSVIIIVSLLGALQLFMLGVIGEYLGRVLREVRNRPIYIVRETNCDDRPLETPAIDLDGERVRAEPLQKVAP